MSECLILVTEWNEFKHLDMQRIKELMAGTVLIDGRNIWDPAEMDGARIRLLRGRPPASRAKMDGAHRSGERAGPRRGCAKRGMSQLTFLEGGEHQASPIRRQYLDIKRRYPDAILLFRLGDFYETFDDDARVVVGGAGDHPNRPRMGRGERVPLAGIPYHAAEGYIARLIAKGLQGRGLRADGHDPVQGPRSPRGGAGSSPPAPSSRTRFFLPGANNYLASLYLSPRGRGIRHGRHQHRRVSPSRDAGGSDGRTGFSGRAGTDPPRGMPVCLQSQRGRDSTARSRLPRGPLRHGEGRPRTLAGSLRAAAEAAFRRRHPGWPWARSSPTCGPGRWEPAGYLQETQPASVAATGRALRAVQCRWLHEAGCRRHAGTSSSPNAQVASRRFSLLHVLDRTRTPMGARLLRHWVGQPLLDVDEIQARLDRVEEMVSRRSDGLR